MKAQHQEKARESAIVMDLADLEREAGQIVSRARSEAAKIVADARAAATREQEQIREAARAAGREEGLRAGLAEGQKLGHEEAVGAVAAQLKELTARWSQTLELLQQHMPSHIADSRTDLIKLALTIASRVTHQEALSNRQVAPAVVEEALRMVAAGRRIAVHVNPLELAALEEFLPDLLATLRSIEEVELTPDESVTAGGAVLRFGAGEIDATIETQLARIAAELGGA